MIVAAVFIVVAGVGAMVNIDSLLSEADKQHIAAADHFHAR